MAAHRRRSPASPELTERQRYWLRHLETAARKGETLKDYAKRRGLHASSLYEAKRRLRQRGVLPRGKARRRPPAPRFVRVVAAERETRSGSPLRVQLGSGAVLEWAEAPCGEALRELIGSLR